MNSIRWLHAVFSATLLAAMLICLPLAGAVLNGSDPGKYLQFPPATQHVVQPGFSWPVFIGVSILIAVAIAPFLIRATFMVTGRTKSVELNTHAFPWWGWLGVAWTAFAWLLAWTRFEWMEPAQLYMFPAIWLGYIVSINAFTYRRSARCMLLDRPRMLLLLFPVSAVFWWFFEYLNRFVQNWYYVVPRNLDAVEYALVASLCFSTVLPAVLGTAEWLKTFRVTRNGFANWFPVRLRRGRMFSALAFMTSALGLVAIGLWPTVLYSFLWLAPLVLITSWQGLWGRRTVFSPLTRGDWSDIVTAAMAGIVCGFFWEMWNYYNWAKWVYAVPYVQRSDLMLFEMPLVGFAGYFPFGLECLVVGSIIYDLSCGSRR